MKSPEKPHLPPQPTQTAPPESLWVACIAGQAP